MSLAEPVHCTRVVAAAGALDAAEWTTGSTVLRTAPDEALVLGGGVQSIDDDHAIVLHDSSWAQIKLARSELQLAMQRLAAWPMPDEGFGQGMIAGIAAKVWVDSGGRGWFLVGHSVLRDFEERLVVALETSAE